MIAKELFKPGYELSQKQSLTLSFWGLMILLGIWSLITFTGWVGPATIPTPLSVIKSFKELFLEDNLVGNTFYSIRLNIYGYVEAIAIAIPLGFLIGLFPFFKGLFHKYIDALRFVPLTGLVGVFIAWFGIGVPMKAHFLAFGIIVYLLPIVVQRVLETEKVHIDTVWTLGASKWQLIKYVYIPSVISKLSVDIRVITAISWTYIIVAEMVNNEGGVGAMIYLAGRRSRLDKIFAIILLIIVIGFLQDKLFKWLDSKFFKHKNPQNV